MCCGAALHSFGSLIGSETGVGSRLKLQGTPLQELERKRAEKRRQQEEAGGAEAASAVDEDTLWLRKESEADAGCMLDRSSLNVGISSRHRL